MTIQQISELMQSHAARVYAAGAAEVQPLCHAETADGRVFPIMLEWGSREEKDASLDGLRQMFKARQVVRYGIMAEAWSARYGKGNASHNAVMPSEREDRQEVVSISVADVDGRKLTVVREIDRDAGGRPSLGKVSDMLGVGAITSGRMLELLD